MTEIHQKKVAATQDVVRIVAVGCCEGGPKGGVPPYPKVKDNIIPFVGVGVSLSLSLSLRAACHNS